MLVFGAAEDDWRLAPEPSKMLTLAKNTAVTYVGLATAGIALGPAALIAFPAAMIVTWWSSRKGRQARIDYYKSIGVYGKPEIRRRGVWTGGRSGSRYGASGEIADDVIEVMAEARPELSNDELEQIWHACFKTIRSIRASIPDVPAEFVADVVLGIHGIHKEGEAYRYKEEQPKEADQVVKRAEDQAETKTPVWVYGLLAFVIGYAVITRRG